MNQDTLRRKMLVHLIKLRIFLGNLQFKVLIEDPVCFYVALSYPFQSSLLRF